MYVYLDLESCPFFSQKIVDTPWCDLWGGNSGQLVFDSGYFKELEQFRDSRKGCFHHNTWSSKVSVTSDMSHIISTVPPQNTQTQNTRAQSTQGQKTPMSKLPKAKISKVPKYPRLKNPYQLNI